MWIILCKLAIQRHRMFPLGQPWKWHEDMIVAVYGRNVYERALRSIDHE